MSIVSFGMENRKRTLLFIPPKTAPRHCWIFRDCFPLFLNYFHNFFRIFFFRIILKMWSVNILLDFFLFFFLGPQSARVLTFCSVKARCISGNDENHSFNLGLGLGPAPVDSCIGFSMGAPMVQKRMRDKNLECGRMCECESGCSSFLWTSEYQQWRNEWRWMEWLSHDDVWLKCD